MYLNKNLVFVAGSTGIAGSSIMQFLLENYPAIKIRASYYKHTKPFVKDNRIDYVYGDLRSEKFCAKSVSGCDCVVMAAANTAGSNVVNPSDYGFINDNLLMNVQILNACRLANVTRVVYVGSASLYQEFQGRIKEKELDLNKDPHAAYLGIGWIVRYTEKLCKFWHEQTGMDILIARTANIFGPYAKFSPAAANFIPALIRKAVDKIEPFDVFGSPDTARDVIYSQDFARAIAMMLDNDKVKFDIFNIGSGVKTTVSDAVDWALKYSGHSPKEIKYLPGKLTVRSRLLDCSKAKKILGWQPRLTIEESVKKTTEWWIKNRRSWKK